MREMTWRRLFRIALLVGVAPWVVTSKTLHLKLSMLPIPSKGDPMKQARITLIFNVFDPELLTQVSDKAIEGFGETTPDMIVDSKNPYSSRIIELILHSNPNIPDYVESGFELQDQILNDRF
jgi:hypothetical protein